MQVSNVSLLYFNYLSRMFEFPQLFYNTEDSKCMVYSLEGHQSICLTCNFSYIDFSCYGYIYFTWFLYSNNWKEYTKPNFPKFIDTGCTPHEFPFIPHIPLFPRSSLQTQARVSAITIFQEFHCTRSFCRFSFHWPWFSLIYPSGVLHYKVRYLMFPVSQT